MAAIHDVARILEDVPAGPAGQHLLAYDVLIDEMQKKDHRLRAAKWAIYVLLSSPPTRPEVFKQCGQLAEEGTCVVARPEFFIAQDAATDFGCQHDRKSGAEARQTSENVGMVDGSTTCCGKGNPKPSHQRAYLEFQRAMDQNPSMKTDRDVYDWLVRHSDSSEELPKFNTWHRYLRAARDHYNDHKRTPRKSKTPSGKSVVRQDEI